MYSSNPQHARKKYRNDSRNNNEIFENKKINVDLSPRMSVITINVNRLKYTN